MAYFSEIAKKAINSAHGEKMADWEGKKFSDHHDAYTRDTYMPMEDANERRYYRAKGGEIPELEAKKGGAMKKMHAAGKEVHRKRGGDMPRDMFPGQGKGMHVLKGVKHCK